MKNEDIEVIDAFEKEQEKTKEFKPFENNTRRKIYRDTKARNQLEVNLIEEAKEKRKPTTVKKFKTGLFMQTIFCSFSFLFIIGCCFFYGTRLVKYYRIYNPTDASGKTLSLLSNKITSSETFVYSGKGLYLKSGSYIYKGNVTNNYISFSGFTWRILRINEDKTIDLVLDTSINNLKWNNKITNYSNSDMNKYLTKEFLPLLDEDKLNDTVVCNDKIDSVDNITCDDMDSSNKVRLLTIDEFLNSKSDEESYISNGSSIWLSSRSKTQAWIINNTSLSISNVDVAYDVKPVITLKNSVAVTSGKGTKKDPYIIGEKSNSITYGDHIKLGTDIWTVYNIKGKKLYLSLTKGSSKTYRFSTKLNTFDLEDKYGIAYYLNNTYIKTLSYKDKLLDNDWYTGTYDDSYKDTENSKVTAKIGLTSIEDFKFDDIDNYYLLNGTKDGKIYMYNDGLIETKTTMSRVVKPSIVIKSSDIKSGTGSIDDPYVLGD